jgi:TetR/AcrR family transcriptional regulator, cholesterol catabolism regulator
MAHTISPKKKSIMDAAARLFTEKGYNASSMRDLALKVGLEPSSIYSHIKSKEELLTHICMSCADRFTTGMHAVLNGEGDATDKLKKLIRLHVDIAYDDPYTIAVFNDEWKFLPQVSMTAFMSLRKQYEHHFNAILLEGKEAGIFHFSKQDITYNVIMKSISWSYGAYKKHSRSAVGAELETFILQALSAHQ